MKVEVEWHSVDKCLPGKAQYVLVHCEGGNVAMTFYTPHREFLRSRKGCSSYSRKVQGKNSGYFEIAHEYGYKILHWAYQPEAPKQGEAEDVK